MLKIIREYKKGIDIKVLGLEIYRELDWKGCECKKYLVVKSDTNDVYRGFGINRVSTCSLIGCIAYGKSFGYDNFCFDICILLAVNFPD